MSEELPSAIYPCPGGPGEQRDRRHGVLHCAVSILTFMASSQTLMCSFVHIPNVIKAS
jgi:hypothetical protein